MFIMKFVFAVGFLAFSILLCVSLLGIRTYLTYQLVLCWNLRIVIAVVSTKHLNTTYKRKLSLQLKDSGATKLDMTELEAAKRLRSTTKGKFTRTANYLDQAIDTGAPTKTIKNRYRNLKLLPSEELHECWIEDLTETFSELEVRADRYLEEAIKTKEQDKELKILKETEVAEIKACQLAELQRKKRAKT